MSSEWIATVDEALSARWKVVDAGYVMRGFQCEDMSIVTEDDKEVIGCSEWIRAERSVFEYIVKLHNASLPNIGINRISEAH